MMQTEDERRTKLVDKLRQEMNAEHKIHADPNYLRLWNERLILNYIRRVGLASRSEIVLATGLTRSAVGNIIPSLKEQYFLEDEETEEISTGGRPTSEVRFRGNAGYIIGVDIGRSHLTVIITDLEAKGGKNKRTPFELAQDVENFREDKNGLSLWFFNDDDFDAERGADVCLPEVAAKVHELVQKNAIDWRHIVGIGIGLPGTHDKHRTRLARAMMMAGWSEVDIPDTLRMLLRLKGQRKIPIYLDNDANLGALGESRYGTGQGKTDIAFVKIGTGIGAGLVFDGKLHHGHRSIAGEFGHQIVDLALNRVPDSIAEELPHCEGCGNRGCLEVLAAEPAIVRHAGLKVTSTEGKVDIRDVLREEKNNNEQCHEALVQAGKFIGAAIANLISLLDPELVVLGGHVIHEIQDYDVFMESLREQANLCVPAARGTEIEIAALRRYSVAYGAVAQVIDEAFRAPVLSDIRQI